MKTYFILLLCLIVLYSISFAQQYPGLTLIVPQDNNVGMLVDTNGFVCKKWNFTSGNTGYTSYLLANRTLLRTIKYSNNTFVSEGQTGMIERIDWDGRVLWSYTYTSATYSMHHDVYPVYNGNILLISYDLHTAEELKAAGCSADLATLWSEKVVEIQPVGTSDAKIVWEWRAWDHLCQNYDSTKQNYVRSIKNNPQLFNINNSTQKEWLKIRSIDFNLKLNQIIISSENWNEFFVIDHSTTTAQAASHEGGKSGKGGDILYRWGNPANYQASGTKMFNGLSGSHWIPEGSPHKDEISTFNTNATTTNSNIETITPPLNGVNYNIVDGQAYLPEFYSTRMNLRGKSQDYGAFQHLPNGNIIVSLSKQGIVQEYTPSGILVWEYKASGTIPKATKYLESYYVPPLKKYIKILGPTSLCENTTLSYSIDHSAFSVPIQNLKYNWYSIPQGVTGTKSSISVTIRQTTMLVASVTDGIDTLLDTLIVLTRANPHFPNIYGKRRVLAGSTEEYSVDKQDSVIYFWSETGNIAVDTNTNSGRSKIRVVWGNAIGNGSVTATVSQLNGTSCTSSRTMNVQITQDTTLCVPSVLSFNNNLDSKQLVINTKTAWTISKIPSWLTLNKTSGVGNDIVTVTAIPNVSPTDRSATISCSVTGLLNETYVVQKGTESVKLDIDTLYVGAEHAIYVVPFRTGNISWQASSNSPWLDIEAKSGSLDGNLLLFVAKNIAEARTSIITFKSGATTKYVVVIQKQGGMPFCYVKIAVDMAKIAVNSTGVYVVGDFQEDAGCVLGNWVENCTRLQQEGTSTIYSTIVRLLVNHKYEFRFQNGNQFTNSEIVPRESRVWYDLNPNRWFITDVPERDTLIIGDIVYDKNAPLNKKIIRLRVQSDNSGSNDTVRLYARGTLHSTEVDTVNIRLYSFYDSIFDGYLYADSNSLFLYKFGRGTSEKGLEDIQGNCTNNGSRSINASSDRNMPIVCFGACADCNVTTSVPDEIVREKINLYPNPFSNIVSLLLPLGKYKLELVDMLGSILYCEQVESVEVQTISFPKVPSGIYILRITNTYTGSVDSKILVRQ